MYKFIKMRRFLHYACKMHLIHTYVHIKLLVLIISYILKCNVEMQRQEVQLFNYVDGLLRGKTNGLYFAAGDALDKPGHTTSWTSLAFFIWAVIKVRPNNFGCHL